MIIIPNFPDPTHINLLMKFLAGDPEILSTTDLFKTMPIESRMTFINNLRRIENDTSFSHSPGPAVFFPGFSRETEKYMLIILLRITSGFTNKIRDEVEQNALNPACDKWRYVNNKTQLLNCLRFIKNNPEHEDKYDSIVEELIDLINIGIEAGFENENDLLASLE